MGVVGWLLHDAAAKTQTIQIADERKATCLPKEKLLLRSFGRNGRGYDPALLAVARHHLAPATFDRAHLNFCILFQRRDDGCCRSRIGTYNALRIAHVRHEHRWPWGFWLLRRRRRGRRWR